MIVGQRGPDHGLIERRQEDPDHHRAEDPHPNGMRELDRRAIVGSEQVLVAASGHWALLPCLVAPNHSQRIRSISFLIAW